MSIRVAPVTPDGEVVDCTCKLIQWEAARYGIGAKQRMCMLHFASITTYIQEEVHELQLVPDQFQGVLW